jgi:hypothetical protein
MPAPKAVAGAIGSTETFQSDRLVPAVSDRASVVAPPSMAVLEGEPFFALAGAAVTAPMASAAVSSARGRRVW